MKNPTEVYVLLDSTDSTVYGVVTSESIAEEFATLDPSFTVAGPIDVNDLTLFNEAAESAVATEPDYE